MPLWLNNYMAAYLQNLLLLNYYNLHFNNTIDVSELKGIYAVNIHSQEKRITKILVVK